MSCRIGLGGMAVELHPSGCAWVPALELLCAADIHLEKGSYFSRFATLLPPYDTHASLARLGEAIARFRPRLFVALGDSFHDAEAVSRMEAQDRETLRSLIRSVGAWVWVEGNHDPAIHRAIEGERRAEYTIGGLTFRHQSDPLALNPEISGHYHPKTAVSVRGHAIRAPCFVHVGQKLILPAFGAYAGGMDVNHLKFPFGAACRERRLYLAHREKIYAL